MLMIFCNLVTIWILYACNTTFIGSQLQDIIEEGQPDKEEDIELLDDMADFIVDDEEVDGTEAFVKYTFFDWLLSIWLLFGLELCLTCILIHHATGGIKTEKL